MIIIKTYNEPLQAPSKAISPNPIITLVANLPTEAPIPSNPGIGIASLIA
jgi:hypothetical protein